MQAFFSLPAFVLYGIVAAAIMAGVMVTWRESRNDRRAVPDFELPRPIDDNTYPYPDPCPAAGVYCQQCGTSQGCAADDVASAGDRAADDAQTVAWLSELAAERAWTDPQTEPWSFAAWEAEQDRLRAADLAAAARTWDVLESGVWADAWWLVRAGAH